MKRAYSRATYLDKVAMARELIDGLALTTDIIVGFPGETDEEFADTLDLVERVRFDAAYTFQYSPRPYTEAADQPGHLPKHVVQERYNALHAVQRDISLERNLADIGKTMELTVEATASKTDARTATGRSRTNKIVHFVGDDLTVGQTVTVTVTSARSHFLRAELVS